MSITKERIYRINILTDTFEIIRTVIKNLEKKRFVLVVRNCWLYIVCQDAKRGTGY